MKTNTFTINNIKIIEIISDEIIVWTTQDALDIIANNDSDHLVLHEHNFENDFFDLSTQKLGEILQKFTNYQVKLAVIGDFEKYRSQSLKAFIYESNLRKNYLFVNRIEEVKRIWS